MVAVSTKSKFGEVEDVKRKFLIKLFPPPRYLNVKSTITTFLQGPDESLYEAREKYKSLLRMCPNHKFDDVIELNMFYNELRSEIKMFLDAFAGGFYYDKECDRSKQSELSVKIFFLYKSST